MIDLNQYDAHHTRLSRRAFLGHGAYGLSALGLHSLLGRIALAEDTAPAALLPTASAKRVILIFMNGGLSHLDVFDEKSLLHQRRGEEIPKSVLKNPGVLAATSQRGSFPVVGSAFRFKQHGECGMNLSEVIPSIASVADECTLIRTLQTDHSLHEAAISTLLTGTQLLGRPSFGAWVSYALGSENENIPKFVVLGSDGQGDSPVQPRLWGSGFLPGRYQGVRFREGSAPVLDLNRPDGMSEASQKSVLEAIKALNEQEYERTADPSVQTRIESYEMASRMQTSVPELTDLKKESKETLELYGADPEKHSFARNCLLARRLVEQGVRFLSIIDGGWDHHDDIPRSLSRKCESIDKGVGALIADLKRRGLLDDTLVVLTSEFGRTPHCQGSFGDGRYGRDHHPLAYGAILAGGGVRRGLTYGQTDEWGWDVVENPVHVHDLQATALHCLGLDHEKLTFRHQGRDFRLTDVGGRVVKDILA